MKVLILSTYDINGGAAIAAYRSLEALLAQGIDAKMLVAVKQSSHDRVMEAKSIFGNKRQKVNLAIEKATFLKDEKNKSVRFQFSKANIGYQILQEPSVQEADIIHIHWTLQGFLSIRMIEKLQKLGKKVFWTLHDMWAFTGGCHYSGDCQHFMHSCGQCPLLNVPADKDLSHQIWQKKRIAYQNIHFVTCSDWLRKIAKTSSLLKDFTISHIPNPIDTEVYTSISDKASLRQKLGWIHNKNYILFGAASLSDARKGIQYFLDALKLYHHEKTELPIIVLYGGQKEAIQIPNYEVIHLGYLAQDELLKYYQACDLFAITSLEDNLPNTVMEALSCGLPVLSFDTGGIPEMVQHLLNGYVAVYKSVIDFKNGMIQMLEKEDLFKMSQYARNMVLEKFSQKVISHQLIELYRGSSLKL